VTLRLVSDNANPTGPDYGDIPAMLRQYAAEIEAGQYGDLLSVILLAESEGSIMVLGCGEDPTPYELMGICEAAKLQVFADTAIADD
jgi:hypothetical protein